MGCYEGNERHSFYGENTVRKRVHLERDYKLSGAYGTCLRAAFAAASQHREHGPALRQAQRLFMSKHHTGLKGLGGFDQWKTVLSE